MKNINDIIKRQSISPTDLEKGFKFEGKKASLKRLNDVTNSIKQPKKKLGAIQKRVDTSLDSMLNQATTWSKAMEGNKKKISSAQKSKKKRHAKIEAKKKPEEEKNSKKD